MVGYHARWANLWVLVVVLLLVGSLGVWFIAIPIYAAATRQAAHHGQTVALVWTKRGSEYQLFTLNGGP